MMLIAGAAAAAAADDDDGPYAYSVLGPVKKLPNGGRPATPIKTPAVTDWNASRITLERGPCFGTCPSYSVVVQGDGTVIFEGRMYVAITGRHVSKITPEAVRALFAAFAKAEFFWTFDLYVARNITDLSAYRLGLTVDGRTKQVGDYAGPAVGMPKAVWQLEDLVDQTVGTDKWVKGTDATFATLKAEGWDFRAPTDANQSLLGAAAARGRAELVRQFLQAGIDAKTKYGCEGLAQAASQRPNLAVVTLLLDAGAPLVWDAPPQQDETHWDPLLPCDALAAAAAGGDPDVVSVVLARRPDINRIGPSGQTALMVAAQNTYSGGDVKRDYGAVVRLLIAAGADVNRRDNDGESAIMKVHDAATVRALIAAGAKDINEPDRRGLTVLMTTYDADTAQALLESGADPWRINADGRNALQEVTATYSNESKTIAVLKAWMATHPKPAP